MVEVLGGGIRLRPNSFVNSAEDLDYDLIRGNEDGNFKVELLKLDHQQQQQQRKELQLLHKQQRDRKQQPSSYNNNEEEENHEKIVESDRMHDSPSTTNQNEYHRSAFNNEMEPIRATKIEENKNKKAEDEADSNRHLENDNNDDDDEVDEEDRNKSPFLFQIVTTHPLDAEAQSMYNLVLRVRHR